MVTIRRTARIGFWWTRFLRRIWEYSDKGFLQP